MWMIIGGCRCPAAATPSTFLQRTAGVDSLQQRRALLLSTLPQLKADQAKLGGGTWRNSEPAVGQQQRLKRTLADQPAQGQRGGVARGPAAGRTHPSPHRPAVKKQGSNLHRQGWAAHQTIHLSRDQAGGHALVAQVGAQPFGSVHSHDKPNLEGPELAAQRHLQVLQAEHQADGPAHNRGGTTVRLPTPAPGPGPSLPACQPASPPASEPASTARLAQPPTHRQNRHMPCNPAR